MRTRLMLVLSLLGALTVALFAVPLALASAQSRTNEFALARGGDLERFVALAGPAVRSEDAGNLPGEMQAYTELYDEQVGVVSVRGTPSRPEGFVPTRPQVADAVARALRNQPVGVARPLTPWGPEEIVFARATGTDAQITGAVVLVATTAAARADIARSWTVIAVGGVLALAALLAVAAAVSAWVLRPLGQLSAGMRELVTVLPRAPDPAEDGRLLPPSARSGPPELRELAQTFALMAGQVRRSTEAQRRLVADTAHQLRNPLAALQLRLDALEGRVEADAEEGHRLAVAEADRLAGLLDALLDLARAELPVGIAGPQRSACRPVLVARDRTEAWEAPAERRGVVLHPPAGPADVVAAFDDDDLAQVLDVLLDNACKYAGAGSEVTISVGARDGAVRLSVADTGGGVPSSELPRLRERFYRGPGAVGSRGTGLGLAIVETLVSAGGGRMELAPTGDRGLTVEVELPAAPDSDAPVRPPDGYPAVDLEAGRR